MLSALEQREHTVEWERVIVALSEDGTYENAERKITQTMGEYLQNFLRTNLYEHILVTVEAKYRGLQNEVPVVQWRVTYICIPFHDGVVHFTI